MGGKTNLIVLVAILLVASTGCLDRGDGFNSRFRPAGYSEGELIRMDHFSGIDGDNWTEDDSINITLEIANETGVLANHTFQLFQNINNLSFLNESLYIGAWVDISYYENESNPSSLRYVKVVRIDNGSEIDPIKNSFIDYGIWIVLVALFLIVAYMVAERREERVLIDEDEKQNH